MNTILIVEDSIENYTLLRKRLEKEFKGEELNIVHAIDGEQALNYALKNAPNLILMDVNLPGIDGHSATVILKDNKSTEDIPIIAITADTTTSNREKLSQLKYYSYTFKPIHFKEFLEVVRKILFN